MTCTSDESVELPIDRPVSRERLAALDCLRGLMLAIVLADHIDARALGAGSIKKWTLMGLGFSDAADVFIFLSGFVFGYVYWKRFENYGVWFSLQRGMFRTLQIYFGFLLTAACVLVIQSSVGMFDWTSQWQRVLSIANLSFQPTNTAILCLYVVLLPWLLLLLVLLGKRSWWVTFGLSLGVYIAAQFRWTLPGGDWSFQPCAWQFLMVIAVLLGQNLSATGSTGIPRSKTLLSVSALVLLIGLLVNKSDYFPYFEWLTNQPFLRDQQWIGKSHLAPLRLIHHLSLVYATIYFIPLRSAIWSARALEPFRACGRHSLTIYCIGVVLSQASVIVFSGMGTAPLDVWLLALSALAIQSLIAILLDVRRHPKQVT